MTKIGTIYYTNGDTEMVFDDEMLRAHRIYALDALQDIIADATDAYNYLIEHKYCTLNQYIKQLPNDTKNWAKQNWLPD